MGLPTFTVLLPVHRPPALLPYAIASVQAQARADFELLVICDGAPEETAACARRLGGSDARIRVFAHPKGERNGEAWRHLTLGAARGTLIAQIADDDLWFPNHLDELKHLLDEVDFGNLSQVGVHPDGRFRLYAGDLRAATTRRRMLNERYNFFGPTVAGYRLSAYRRLPVGWAPAPPEVWSDLHMWRKFLAADGLTHGTRVAFTSLSLPSRGRKDWPLEKRQAETASWAERIGDARVRDAIAQKMLRVMLRAAAQRNARTARARRSATTAAAGR